MAIEAKAELVFVRHHIAHSFSSLFGSDFSRSSILTMDGMGEFDSAVVSSFHDGEFEIIST